MPPSFLSIFPPKISVQFCRNVSFRSVAAYYFPPAWPQLGCPFLKVLSMPMLFRVSLACTQKGSPKSNTLRHFILAVYPSGATGYTALGIRRTTPLLFRNFENYDAFHHFKPRCTMKALFCYKAQPKSYSHENPFMNKNFNKTQRISLL